MKNNKIKSCQKLFNEFSENKNILKSELLIFNGVEGFDVYNPSCPFEINGKNYIAGRVESRNGHDSRVCFFEEINGQFFLCKNAPQFNMEDPFIEKINGEFVLGGVCVEWENGNAINYLTRFYKGKDIFNLKHFADGPDKMKDIRLVELHDKKIGVFSRPRDVSKIKEWGSFSKIGFTIIEKLEDLNAEVISNAKFLDGQFIGEEWGGCNQAIILKNGLIGVIGHKAFEKKENNEETLHYYGIAFAFNPYSFETTESKIIISRDCFPYFPPKYPKLADITFTAGIIKLPDQTAEIYTGLSDSACGRAIIPDPFIEWEK